AGGRPERGVAAQGPPAPSDGRREEQQVRQRLQAEGAWRCGGGSGRERRERRHAEARQLARKRDRLQTAITLVRPRLARPVQEAAIEPDALVRVLRLVVVAPGLVDVAVRHGSLIVARAGGQS